MRYIRYVIGAEAAHPDELTGIVTEARFLIDKKLVSKKEKRLIKKTFNRLNKKLPCPPWSQNDWEYGVSWFRRKRVDKFAYEIKILAALLTKHNKPFRVIRSNDPGKIVYRDKYQVVAIAWRDVEE